MKKYLLTILFLGIFGIFSVHAQSVLGKWKTFDDETGEPKSIVEITAKENKIYGKVIEILNPAKKGAKCEKCEGEDKNKPILGFVVIRELSKKSKNGKEEYTDGKIVDPNKGKSYKCVISLDGNDKLNVRGYIGTPMLGRTQTWTRVK